MAIDISGLGFFLPIISFFFVFLVVYVFLSKIEAVKSNVFIHLFMSFFLALLFSVNLSLMDFVNFFFSLFVVFLVCVFFIIVLVMFTHGNLDALMKPWVSWILAGGLIGFFIVSSAYSFNWAVNWVAVWDWFDTDWFGMVLLLVIALIVSWILTKK